MGGSVPGAANAIYGGNSPDMGGLYTPGSMGGGDLPPILPTPSPMPMPMPMGMDPAMMQKLMAAQYLQGAAGSLGNVGASRQGPGQASPMQTPQQSPGQVPPAIAQPMPMGLVAQEKARKLVEERMMMPGFYGMFR